MRSRLLERFPPAGRSPETSKCVYSTVNEDPQPQVEVAFGFLIVKPPPVTVSMPGRRSGPPLY